MLANVTTKTKKRQTDSNMKTLEQTGGHARQGDVLIRRVPEGAPAPRNKVAPTLAMGEVTGHHHSYSGAVTAYADEDGSLAQVLDVPCDEPLTHQEHGPVPTPPGRYEVLKQVEDTGAEITRVAD
jgi:hypothetical protein